MFTLLHEHQLDRGGKPRTSTVYGLTPFAARGRRSVAQHPPGGGVGSDKRSAEEAAALRDLSAASHCGSAQACRPFDVCWAPAQRQVACTHFRV